MSFDLIINIKEGPSPMTATMDLQRLFEFITTVPLNNVVSIEIKPAEKMSNIEFRNLIGNQSFNQLKENQL